MSANNGETYILPKFNPGTIQELLALADRVLKKELIDVGGSNVEIKDFVEHLPGIDQGVLSLPMIQQMSDDLLALVDPNLPL